MMSSIQYLMDRLAIQDTLVRFSTAMDTKNLDLLDQVFTADALLDYGQYWGPGNLEEFGQWARISLSHFSACQHLLCNFVIEISGDSASTRTEFYNPVFTGEGDRLQLSQAYGHYLDKLVRIPDGWRISERKMIPLAGLDPDAIR